MSAQASPHPDSTRFPFLDELLAAGWVSLLGVVLAGATLGFFGWYGLIVLRHHPEIANVGLPVALVAGMLGSVWAWLTYGRYFSRRTGIRFSRALQYDVLSWLPFLLLWLSFSVLPQISHGWRLLAICIALFAAVKLIVAARFNQTVREVLVDFIVTRAAIILIAELASVIIMQRPGTHVSESTHPLLAVWGRWDAVHYLDIATKGYQGTDMAFFPLFPLLIHILGSLLGNHLVAGLVISNVSFFFGLLFLYKLLEHEYDRSVARRAIFYVSIFPTAIFFSAVYTESLFFMLTVGSFYYMRERKWWLAGLIGMFATLTRVEGVLLMIPFAIELWNAHHSAETNPSRGMLAKITDAAAAALIPAGMLIYMGYLWVLRGDPLYFSHVQIHWNRHFAPPWVSVMHAFAQIRHATTPQIAADQTLEIAFTALMIGVLLVGWKRLRPSYIVYMTLSIVIPMCTSSLMSMPRFALVLFPMFAILARWGERPGVNNTIVAFSLPLLGFYTVLFADWYWVA